MILYHCQATFVLMFSLATSSEFLDESTVSISLANLAYKAIFRRFQVRKVVYIGKVRPFNIYNPFCDMH